MNASTVSIAAQQELTPDEARILAYYRAINDAMRRQMETMLRLCAEKCPRPKATGLRLVVGGRA